MKRLNWALYGIGIVLSIVFTQVAFADDIDDIETDMESTIAESDAAQSAATATKKSEIEEREALQKSKSAANDAMKEAKKQQAEAASQLKVLEAKIAAHRTERQKHENLKAISEKKIIVSQQKVIAKKSDFEAAQAALSVAKEESAAQQKILDQVVSEQQGLEKNIAADRAEIKKLNLEIASLKKRTAEKEKALLLLRENAKKEAANLAKAKAQRDASRRTVSSVPTKVILRSPKMNCEVTGAATDGALTIGAIKKGTKYEVYRVVDRKWVELQMGKRHGFAPKSCF